MIIGVDFDNTLVSYDALFRHLAIERGFSLPAGVQTKDQVRDHVRAREDGEIEWRQLQGLAYGPRIGDAELLAGVDVFFRLARASGASIYVVSHKTSVSPYVDPPADLRSAATEWMRSHGFFRADRLGLRADQVFFADSRAGKIERIRALGCTHFIDDLEDVLLDPAFPPSVQRLLFAPRGRVSSHADLVVCESWAALGAHLFGVRA